MPSNLRLVLLSGPIGSGKSELAKLLSERHGAKVIRTRDLIRAAVPNVADERAALQRAGDKLDRTDSGIWIKTALARIIEQAPTDGVITSLFVVDAVRIAEQIAAVRDTFRTNVHHVHLTAREDELARRYDARRSASDVFRSFAEARAHRTERKVASLGALADVVVEADRSTQEGVLVRATALLGLYPRSVTPLVDVLVGGQYGSEGKGNIVGHIAPEYDLLVRVGGPNAGHKVFGDPIQVYYQIPSGAQRAPHARLLLGAGAVLRVETLLKEIQDHSIEVERLSIDPRAMIISDQDILDEGALKAAISSTGQGVGAASARKIMGRSSKVMLAGDIPELRPYIRDAQEVLEAAYLKGSRILLEGTQGTSLSMHHGPYP